MNNQLIEKIITSNNLPCPEFIFDNPLLDKNVAKVLSKSFVKILNLSQQNSNINSNLRISILESIRRMCLIEPNNHIRVDENITTLLSEIYEQKIKYSNVEFVDSTNKVLDEFLIQNMKDMNINSNYNMPLSPDTVQALINLNKNGVYLNKLCQDVIHWNASNNKNFHILKDLWTSDNLMAEDISVKLKPELEKILLEICYAILNDVNSNIDELFISNMSLKNILRKSSSSATCFQMSCSILNYLFIKTNFSKSLQTFIQSFVAYVKKNSKHVTFSVLYPTHLTHIVVLLDVEIEELPASVQDEYIEAAVKYLSDLQLESEDDLIMLLCHFPMWFDIFFNKKMVIK